MTAAFNLSQFANKVNTSGQADLTTAVTGVLPAANGGTGLSSPGTSGNVLQSNGSAWTSATIAIFAGNSGQAFTTVGTGQTFTIPSGITKLKVTVVAGGGAGGTSYYDSSRGGGGGAGGTAISYLTGLTPNLTLTVNVGSGSGASSVSSGTQTISTISATAGGVGGTSGPGGGAAGNGGNGGSGSGGTINIIGGDGISGAFGGGGGASSMGGGAKPIYPTGVGIAGRAYGSGGSGGATDGTLNNGGGAGRQGVVIFEW